MEEKGAIIKTYVYIVSQMVYNSIRGDIMEKQICTIKGYEDIRDIYFITDGGEVISYGSNNLQFGNRTKKLKLYEKTGGYLNAALVTNDQKTRYVRVNRLVALAFIPNPNNKKIVHHKDEDRKNNKSYNLSWATNKENNLYSLSKKVYVYDLNGNWVKTYDYTRECKEDGFNQGHVCACCRGEERSHKKHVFSYTELTKEEVITLSKKPFYTKGKRYEQLKEAKRK